MFYFTDWRSMGCCLTFVYGPKVQQHEINLCSLAKKCKGWKERKIKNVGKTLLCYYEHNF